MAPTEPTSSTNRLKYYSVAKLAHDSSNWITWKSQMLMTLAASCGVMCHIEGTAQVPPAIPIFPTGHALTEAEEEWLETAKKCHDEYDQ